MENEILNTPPIDLGTESEIITLGLDAIDTDSKTVSGADTVTGEGDIIQEERKRGRVDLFNERSVADFKRVFPSVDAEDIKNSESFQILSTLVDASIPLTDVYVRFKALCQSIEKRALEKSSQYLANKLSGVGALSFGQSTDDGYFTKEQVLKMSQKQISENYEKIRKSQERW